MTRLVLAAAVVHAVLTTPAIAQGGIDPALHQRCLEARDYSGCIQSQSNGTAEPAPTANACPAGHAYSGAGC